MSGNPMRLRRSQLAVPGSSEKMLTKAAASAADHVFCDLEDAVAPSAKAAARETIAEALNNLDWGKKTRCVRVNDIGTQWCMKTSSPLLRKPVKISTQSCCPSRSMQPMCNLPTRCSAIFLTHKIGLEVLIEEVEAMQNVAEIATSCARLESMIFGMGDYAASQGLVMENIGLSEGYPGDIFHYPRYHMTIAARAAGLDAVDGPFVDFKNDAAYRIECQRALTLGMVGKWAIHPSQIEPALEVFSPSQDDVDFAREIIAVYEKAAADGLGSVGHKGVMVDAASARLFQNTVNRAELIGM